MPAKIEEPGIFNETDTPNRGFNGLDIAVAVTVIVFALLLIGREWLAKPGQAKPPSGAPATSATALPSKFEAHTKEGLRLYLEERNYSKAEAEFRASIEAAPNSALGYNNLGSALMEQGKWQEALPVLEKAVALDPQLEVARNNLGWARSERAKHEK